MGDYEEPAAFQPYERLYRHIPGVWLVQDERQLDMLTRVLMRVPYIETLRLLAHARFITVGPMYAEYLSTALLEDSSVVILGDGLLDLPEEKQIEIILPLMAHCILKSRHPRESAYDLAECYGPEGINTPLFDSEMKILQNANVDLRIDVHESKAKVANLVRSWQEQWKAFNER